MAAKPGKVTIKQYGPVDKAKDPARNRQQLKIAVARAKRVGTVKPVAKPPHRSFLGGIAHTVEQAAGDVGKGAATAGKTVLRVSNKAATTLAHENQRENKTGNKVLSGAGGQQVGDVVKNTLDASIKRGAGGGNAISKFGTKAVNDAVDLTTNAIPSVYVPGKTAVQGHPKKAVKMVADPIVHTLEHPVKSFEEHPLNTVLIFRGAKGAIGHGAGRTLRSTALQKSVGKKAGAAIKKAGSLERPAADRVIPGTKEKVPGRYSKDTITKVGQVVVDKTRKPGVRVMTPKQQRTAMNEHVAANQDISRQRRAATSRQTVEALGKPKKTTTIHNLVAQAIVKPTRESVQAHIDLLQREGAKLKEPALVEQNKQTVSDLKRELAKNPDFEKISSQVDPFLRQIQAVDERRVAHGLVDEGQQTNAAHVSHAVAQMGARRPTTSQLDTAVRTAAAKAREAKGTPGHAAAVAEHAGAVAEKKAGGYLRVGGKRITTEEIAAHAKAQGFKEPAFITQAPRSGGSKNFYVPSDRPPSVKLSKKRSGAAVVSGTADFSGRTLHEQALRKELEATAAERHKATLDQIGRRGTDGNLETYRNADQAHRAAANLNASQGDVQWAPVPISPLSGRRAQLDSTLEHVNPTSLHTESVTEALHDAWSGKGTTPGRYVLVSKHQLNVGREHSKPMGDTGAGRAVLKFGGVWRKNVLAFSPKWLAGNVGEGALRSAVAGAGPRSAVTSKNVQAALERLSPAAAEELRVRTVAGGHYSMVDRNSVHVVARNNAEKAIQTVAEKPGAKHAVAAYDAYTNFVFHQMNGRFEHKIQSMMLGRALRDHPLMDGKLLKTSKAAAEDVSRALLTGDGKPNVALMAELGRQVDDMYGKYGKFSPPLRKAIAGYTPFVAWSLNAVNFLTKVLPRDHPVLTALIASANEATQEWRKDHGLQQFLTTVAPGSKPGFLQGSIPGKDGTVLRVSRYTPFGIMDAPGGIGGNLEGLLLPQLSGILSNFAGKDWKGNDLAGRGTTSGGRGLAAAGTTFLESVVPGSNWLEAATGAKLPNVSNSDKDKQPRNPLVRLRKLADPTKYTDKYAGALPISPELRKVNLQILKLQKAKKTQDPTAPLYRSKEYEALLAKRRTLQAQRAKDLKKAKTVRLLPRPLTPAQEAEKRYESRLKRLNADPAAAAEKRYQQRLMRLNARAGG